jgi:EmrB/QacA subfamily drug resistance transporter
MFISAMDMTVVNVAMRTIGAEFGAPLSATGMLNSGYLVSLAVVLPAAGWISDRWGGKPVFLGAITLFTAASALCGMAQSLNQLIAFRILQGIGAGLLTPVGMALLFRTFPPEKRAGITRQLILPIALAPALGPIIGGGITEYLSWRWIFWFNLPVGVFAVLIGAIGLERGTKQEAGPLDKWGFLLSTTAMGLVVYASGQGARYGWDTSSAQCGGLAALALLALLAAVELRADKPLLDLRLAADRLFGSMGLLSLFTAAAIHGILYVFPLMYQEALGVSALQSGLTTFPEALGLMAASQLVPWTYRRLKPKRLMTVTLLCTAAVFIGLSFTTRQTDPWIIRGLMFGIGFFLGQTVGAVPIAAFAHIPPEAMGRATTLFTVQNRLGSVLGLTVMATLLTGAAADAPATADAAAEPYRWAIRAAVLFLLAGLVIALRFRDKDVAATWSGRKASRKTGVKHTQPIAEAVGGARE